MPSAFVSFKSRWGAAVCAQTQQNMDPTIWITEWAPEPRDVYWRNLAIPYMELGCRKFFVGIALFIIVFFYLIPVALVQSLASLQGLQLAFPGLSDLIQRWEIRCHLKVELIVIIEFRASSDSCVFFF